MNSRKHPRNGRESFKSFMLLLGISLIVGWLWSIFAGVIGFVGFGSVVAIFCIWLTVLMSPWGTRMKDWCWDVTGSK